jgi:HTH-type transcriptional regulator / antitoxin HigA
MTAVPEHSRYAPDYALPPGATLVEVLAERGMSQAELARRVGLSAKHVNQIILGAAALSAETALRLERVTGVPAGVWTELEADYRVAQTRQEELARLEGHAGWLRTFPVNELIRRGYIRRDVADVERLRDLLSFFKVATPDAWQQVWALPTAYRRSQAFDVEYAALAAWLRIGEIHAGQLDLHSFDRAKFRASLSKVRELTVVEDPAAWLPQLKRLCAEVGVALVIEPEIKGARIHGAVRWLTSERPLIQLSLRYGWADIFWFTFFHESGHILLHDRKRLTFVDVVNPARTDDSMEREADDFAGRVLLPRAFDQQLARTRSRAQVLALARDAGVHPGVVVGRLQHDGRIPFSYMNGLRVQFRFAQA